MQSALDKENQGNQEMAPPAPEKTAPVEDGTPNGMGNSNSNGTPNNVNGTTNPAYTSDQVFILLRLIDFTIVLIEVLCIICLCLDTAIWKTSGS